MVRFTLNGSPVAIDDVDPHTTLLSWLRSRGLTGTKEGCAEGECGACAVAVLREDSHGVARFDSLNSCLLPLPSASGRSIVTVEGVAAPDGTLHPVQQAMVERGGSQCGYCTPGFVMSLFCEFYRPGRAGYDPEAISGNLCRCTGYRPIVDVARELPAPVPEDPRLPILREPVAAVGSLRCTSERGTFVRPSSLSELFEAWEASPDAIPIAGGTDLMVYANQRYQRWPTLLSLEAVPELRAFELGTELTIGAGFELAALEERMEHEHAGLVPMLQQLLPLFSSRLIRNRATLGGSLGTASPIGDSAPVLLALDAELTLTSRAGRRRIPLRDFFTGYRQTQLAPRELIERVHVPLPVAPLSQFYKVSKRVLDDISTVAAAFTLKLDGEGRVEALRAAYGGIAATPLRALELEDDAVGRLWNEDTVEALQSSLVGFGTPQSDHRGGGDYRRAMIGKLLAKFYADTARAT
ncbi:MAG TPA: FAD binding domain-containing protein [Polyangiales bacterium]|nr:FAD binding domain-containing protein [Polyangiales bacterium]